MFSVTLSISTQLRTYIKINTLTHSLRLLRASLRCGRSLLPTSSYTKLLKLAWSSPLRCTPYLALSRLCRCWEGEIPWLESDLGKELATVTPPPSPDEVNCERGSFPGSTSRELPDVCLLPASVSLSISWASSLTFGAMMSSAELALSPWWALFGEVGTLSEEVLGVFFLNFFPMWNLSFTRPSTSSYSSYNNTIVYTCTRHNAEERAMHVQMISLI